MSNTTTSTTAGRTVSTSDLVNVATIARRRDLTAPAVLAQIKSNEDFPQALDIPGVSKMIFLWSEVSEWYSTRDSARAERDAKREADRLAKIAKAEERLAALKAEAEAEAPAEPKKPGRKSKAKAEDTPSAK